MRSWKSFAEENSRPCNAKPPKSNVGLRLNSLKRRNKPF